MFSLSRFVRSISTRNIAGFNHTVPNIAPCVRKNTFITANPYLNEILSEDTSFKKAFEFLYVYHQGYFTDLVVQGDLRMVKKKYSNELKPETIEKSLRLAALNGHLEIFKFLFHKRSARLVPYETYPGYEIFDDCLMNAVTSGYIDICKYILGFDYVPDNLNSCAVESYRRYPEIYKLLSSKQ